MGYEGLAHECDDLSTNESEQERTSGLMTLGVYEFKKKKNVYQSVQNSRGRKEPPNRGPTNNRHHGDLAPEICAPCIEVQLKRRSLFEIFCGFFYRCRAVVVNQCLYLLSVLT